MTSEALRACSELITVICPTPGDSSFDYTPYVEPLYSCVLARLTAQDQDQVGPLPGGLPLLGRNCSRSQFTIQGCSRALYVNGGRTASARASQLSRRAPNPAPAKRSGPHTPLPRNAEIGADLVTNSPPRAGRSVPCV